jgi:hypothetical protein
MTSSQPSKREEERSSRSQQWTNFVRSQSYYFGIYNFNYNASAVVG